MGDEKTTSLTDYYNQQVNIIRALQPGVINYGEDAIHDTRVAFKRLFSLVEYFQYAVPGKSRLSRRIRHIRSFYKGLGRLRDLHILRKGEAHWPGSFFPRYLHQELNRNESLARFSLHELQQGGWEKSLRKTGARIEKLSARISQGHSSLKLGMLVCDKIQRIQTDLENNPYFIDWHEIRRLVKDIYYLLEIGEIVGLNTAALVSEREVLRKTGSLLGDWHDLYQLQCFLFDYLIKHRDTLQDDRIAELKAMIARLEEYCNALLAKVPAMLINCLVFDMG